MASPPFNDIVVAPFRGHLLKIQSVVFFFQKQENLNVILVDWGPGARKVYGQSVQNTRVVGREIGRFAQFLNAETGASYDRMHLVGHSLGAHIAGYAGAFQPGIGRITGEYWYSLVAPLTVRRVIHVKPSPAMLPLPIHCLSTGYLASHTDESEARW